MNNMTVLIADFNQPILIGGFTPIQILGIVTFLALIIGFTNLIKQKNR
mgnify:CR=1 FL=1